MKKWKLLLVLAAFTIAQAKGQSEEVQQLILNIEKLAQFKQILSDMKKGYTILNGGYNTVKNLSEGNFNLHQTFLDGLMQVSPAVSKYRKVAEIARFQTGIVKEYKSALSRFRSEGLLRPDELDYISAVYGNLLEKGMEQIDDLTMVITAGKLRMSDDERIAAIDRIYEDMQDKRSFLRAFNQQAAVLSVQRAKVQKDARAMGSIYGIKQ